jgi:hypothetical protein
MNLASIHEVMHSLMLGTTTPEAAASHLYGKGRPVAEAARDVARLRIHRRGYLHKIDAVATDLFPVTKKVVVARFGEGTWKALLRVMGSVQTMSEVRFPGASLVSTLAGASAGALGLPAWVSELAELELVERRISIAPDVAPAQELALASVHALRDFRYDVLAVKLSEDPTAIVPAARPNVVAIWRSERGTRHTHRLSAGELRVVRAVYRAGHDGLRALIMQAHDEQRPTLEAAATRLLTGGLVQPPAPSLGNTSQSC